MVDHVDIKCAEAAAILQEWKLVEEQTLMQKHLVVGMTTFHAASRPQILKQLKPRIGKI